MITDKDAAQLAILVQYAMDMTANAVELLPPADPRLYPKWKVQGYITGTDKILGFEKQVCFGFLAESDPGVFVAVIRGTASRLEWLEDAEFFPVPHSAGGLVEDGFYSLYGRMRYVLPDGTVKELAAGILAAVGTGKVTVVGHSLGATLATYLTFDLATHINKDVDACIFASPQTGDSSWAQLFDATVANYIVYNYEDDEVPKVPHGLGFTHLPRAVFLSKSKVAATIQANIDCNHHVLCYAAMLDYEAADWVGALIAKDRALAVCILGPFKAP